MAVPHPCRRCGKRLPPQARFCSRCGADVSPQEVAAAPFPPRRPWRPAIVPAPQPFWGTPPAYAPTVGRRWTLGLFPIVVVAGLGMAAFWAVQSALDGQRIGGPTVLPAPTAPSGVPGDGVSGPSGGANTPAFPPSFTPQRLPMQPVIPIPAHPIPPHVVYPAPWQRDGSSPLHEPPRRDADW